MRDPGEDACGLRAADLAPLCPAVLPAAWQWRGAEDVLSFPPFPPCGFLGSAWPGWQLLLGSSGEKDGVDLQFLQFIVRAPLASSLTTLACQHLHAHVCPQ